MTQIKYPFNKKKKNNASIDSFPRPYSIIVQLNDRGEIDDFHILRVHLIAQNGFVKVFETISQPRNNVYNHFLYRR